MQSIATEHNAPKIIVVNNEKSKFNPTQQIKANTLSIAVSKNETNPILLCYNSLKATFFLVREITTFP